MISIDKYAYGSKLRVVEPTQKLVFVLLTLTIGLWADILIISISIFFIMAYITVYCGGIPSQYYLKLLLIPMSFLIISVITIAINISTTPQDFIYFFLLHKYYIGVSKLGLYKATLLFFKVIASVSCLYFLSLSTPIIDLLAVFRRLKVPKLIVEITGLVYKFIFILLETANIMFTAQNSRLGYINISTAYRSLGMLISTLFIRSYKKGNDIFTSLEARGYDGELNVFEESFEKNNKVYFLSIIVDGALILVVLLLKY